MGAWIETLEQGLTKLLAMSHPTWVRGLKLPTLPIMLFRQVSHPTWVRGLKHNAVASGYALGKSHPTWVRGLKLLRVAQLVCLLMVAPYVGAWIETKVLSLYVANLSKSHPTWVRGLKPKCDYRDSVPRMSHPTWVRGLKQFSV